VDVNGGTPTGHRRHQERGCQHARVQILRPERFGDHPDRQSTSLGAALLENDQPVAYITRALTDAESWYAQIEKELLAILFAAEKFEHYI